MKKMQLNSPEYRALVTSLLGREVEFQDLPQIPVSKSPTVSKALPPNRKKASWDVPSPPLKKKETKEKKSKKSNDYVIINTGYTARLINKFKADEKLVRKGKGKNNDLYIISNPQKHGKTFSKLVLINDELWGKGLYSAISIEESKDIMTDLNQHLKNKLNGIVIFRVNDLSEGDDLVYKLKDLDYCRMFIRDREYWSNRDKYADSDEESESEEDRSQPYDEDQTYKIGNKTFRYIVVDSESG